MSRYSATLFAFALVWGTSQAATATGADARLTPQAEQQAPQRGQDPPRSENRQSETRRWMWWRNAETRAELAITDQQSAEIDQIFQGTVPALKAAKEELDKLDTEVAQVIKAATADEGTVNRLVGRAEHARARLTTTRAVMFYRMHRVLSADQRAKLTVMIERWEAERRKTTDSPRR